MQKYKHILLATDFFEGNALVSERAKKISQQYGAKLSIIHVIERMPVVYGGGEFSIPMDVSLHEMFDKLAWESMTKLAQELEVPKEQSHVEIGPVADTVIALADSLDVDLIVIGSHGHYGLRAILGSSANSVLHQARCDVLAVRINK